MKKKVLAVVLALVMCLSLLAPAGAVQTDPLAVTVQPTDFEGSIGEYAVFSVEAVGSGLSYQWQLKTSDSASWKNTTITGYRTDTITVPITEARIGYRYRCLVTDAAGETVTSESAQLKPVSPVIASGAVGSSILWKLQDNGTLTVSGQGAIPDFGENSTDHWLAYQQGFDCITSLVITEGITAIGAYAFHGCIYMSSVSLPASLRNIGNRAFAWCAGIERITVAPGSNTYRSEGNCVLKGTELVLGCKTSVIPDYVTTIAPYAFYAMTSMPNLTIPDSVESIGDWAFYCCYGQTSLVLPKNLKTIGGAAFYYCRYITSVTVPASLESIGGWAFCNCYDLADVWYSGSEAAWSNVSVSNDYNEYLTNAAFHFVTPFAITADPADVEADVGDTAYFSVSAVGSGLTYQWQLKTSAAAAWKNTTITGYRTDTITVPVTAARIGYRYRCLVTDASGQTLTSGEAELKRLISVPLLILSDPTDYEGDINDTATFCVCAEGEGLSYQWQLKTSAAAAWKNTTSSGCRTDTLSVPITAARIGYRYRCLVTDASGASLTSGEAELKLLAAPFEILEQPEDFEGVVGDTAIFSVCAEGSGLSWQWQLKTSPNAAWKNTTITGYRTDTITVPITEARFGYRYRCVVTDASGATLTSDEAELRRYTPMIASGVTTDGLAWTLTTDGLLTITGEGAIPDYCEDDGSDWLAYRESVTSVVIGSGVTGIGTWAFGNCTDLSAVTLPDSVTFIGEDAFENCSALTGVSFPSALTGIGDRAFLGSGLTALNIPAAVSYIGEEAFACCAGLTSVTVDPLNPDYRSEGNCILRDMMVAVGSELILGCRNSVIPEGTLVISYCAFEGCTGLTSLVIPEGVQSVGSYAFAGCSGLASLTLPNSVTFISDYAFSGCALTELVLPDNLGYIPDGAFYGCADLSAVTIPVGVTYIGDFAFDDCSALTDIYFGGSPEDWSLITIGICNDALTDAVIHFAPIASGTTAAGFDWVIDCDGVLTVTGSGAVPDYVAGSEEDWLGYKDSVTAIVIGEGVTGVGSCAFYFCSEVTALTLPDSLTTVGSYAFGSLLALTELTIPAGVTSVSSFSFYRCSALETITVAAANPVYRSENNCLIRGTELILGCQYSQIPAGVTSIGNSAFAYCSGLTGYDIPEGVTTIGNDAFTCCLNLEWIGIPSSVTTIGEGMVWACYALTDVHYGSTAGDWSLIDISDVNNATLTGANLHFALAFAVTANPVDFTGDIGDTATFSVAATGRNLSYRWQELVSPEAGWAYTTISGCRTDTLTMSFTAARIGTRFRCIISDPLGNKVTTGSAELKETPPPIAVGTTFNGLAWVIDADGVLTVSPCVGDGVIPTYYNLSDADWLYYRDRITAIVIEEGITVIGEWAFGYCAQAAAVSLPNGLTSIGSHAFSGCSALTGVTVPDSVTAIREYAFSSCGLISFDLPAGVTSLGLGALDSCDALERVTVDPNNTVYRSEGNCVLSGTELVLGLNTSVIPYGVTSIGTGAFQTRDQMTAIVIPDSVTSIGGFAFQSCSALESVTLPAGVTSFGPDSFDECFALTEFVIPDGVTSIPNSLFHSCVALESVTIPVSVTSIGDRAFNNCGALTDVYYGGTAGDWGRVAVGENNEALAGATVHFGTVFAITADPADFTGELDETAVFSVSAVGRGLSYQWQLKTSAGAAWRNTTITGYRTDTISVPITAARIGYRYRCVVTDAGGDTLTSGEAQLKQLISVAAGTVSGLRWSLDDSGTLRITGTGAIPDYNSNDSTDWLACKDLITAVVIGDGVTGIGQNAFYGCGSLTDLTLGSGLSSIGFAAFAYCSALTAVTVPAGVTTLAAAVFAGCDALESVTVDPNNAALRGEGNCVLSGTTLIAGCKNSVIPNGTTAIGDYAFYGCSSLTELAIPASVTSIGTGAFGWCRGLTELTIPEGVTAIEDETFYFCDGLTSVTIPASVTSIGDNAFWNCDDLADVYYGGSENAWGLISVGSSNSDLSYAEKHYAALASGTAAGIRWTLDRAGCLRITGTGAMPGYSYDSATDWLACRDSIRSVVIGSGITAIGSYAFGNCANLVSVTLPDTVTDIGFSSFGRCGSLTDINLPEGVTHIWGYAFQYCSSLETLVLPESLTTIDMDAFSFCSSLEEIRIPAAMVSLEHPYEGSIFNGCEGLVRITVDEDNPVFRSEGNCLLRGTELIAGCRTSVIPAGVTSIAAYAFDCCYTLTEINIPASLTSVGYGAFWSCSRLTDVWYGGTASDWNGITIANNNASLGSAELHFVAAEGVTATGLVWRLDTDGVLTVSGSGAMPNYSQNPADWRSCKDDITAVIIRDGVTNVGAYAFGLCSNLRSASLPESVTSIDDYAFFNCYRMNELNFPAELTSIGDWAIADCRCLKEIILPDGVTSIGERAFQECTALTTLGFPTGVTTVPSCTFMACNVLKDVRYNGSASDWSGISFGESNYFVTDAAKHFRTAFGTTANGLEWTLWNNEELVITGSGTIADYPSNSAADWLAYKDSIRSVVIGEGITRIGQRAFDGCQNMITLTFGSDVTTVADYAFVMCVSLEDVFFYGSESRWNGIYFGTGNNIPQNLAAKHCRIDAGVTANGLDWAVWSNGLLTIDGWGAIPSYDGGSSVDNTSDWRPYREFVRSIVIGGDILTIGERAFDGFTSLSEISFTGTTSTVADYAFMMCTSLTNVWYVGSAERFGSISFGTGNNIPQNVATKHYLAAGGLTENLLSWRLDTDGALTIEGHGAIPDYVINGNIDNRSDWRYYKSGIRSVFIGEGITRIGERAFDCCGSLTSVRIPSTVAVVADYAFMMCTSLTDVWYVDSAYRWDFIEFGQGNNIPQNLATKHFNS